MKPLAVLSIICMMTISNSSHAQPEPMTPETLWEFGRISDVRISPDGQQILFGVTYFDVPENKGTRDLYIMPAEGGDPVNITNSADSESGARWRPDGERIGFMKSVDGQNQLFEMDPDGSNVHQLTYIDGGITGFGYAPDIQHIYYTSRVKLDETVADKHPDLEKANAHIADDLMYRHWDRWHDGKYSHVFVASYDEDEIGEGLDIMEGEPYHSPLPPFGGSSQIAWSADGKYIAYTSKKKTGIDWTTSTNSNIFLYNLETGTTEDLTPFNDGYDRNPVFSPDGRFMAWESMKRTVSNRIRTGSWSWTWKPGNTVTSQPALTRAPVVLPGRTTARPCILSVVSMPPTSFTPWMWNRLRSAS